MSTRLLTVILMLLVSVSILPAQAQGPEIETPDELDASLYPPWQLGDKNPARNKGAQFTVPESNIIVDLHGNPMTAELVISSFGHYYGALAALVQAFSIEHPELAGKIFYQTMPFGVITEQMEKNNTITIGNLTLQIEPDVFMGGLGAVEGEIEAEMLTGPPVTWMTTRMAIMIPVDNPANIRSLEDLARPGVRLAMPNPDRSGTAERGIEMLQRLGGDELVNEVYANKVGRGETTVNLLHHRQTPIWLMQGKVDAGLTWETEAIFQEMVGNPITYVSIPAEINPEVPFAAAMVRDARHPEPARAWLDFLTSPAARNIVRRYGFGLPEGNGNQNNGSAMMESSLAVNF